jgi:DNA-binding LacI/PurR family transcriptional regulator
MRPPTIRDVAERAGVSKSLVSLVLRGSDQVRPEKRQAVLAAVEELGYRPNAAARSLSERRTRTVGVLLNDMRNPWFVELLDGLNSLLHAHGLRMLLADGHLNLRLGEDLTRAFTDLRVDGLIAVGTLPGPEALRTAATRVPTVVAGAREPVLPHVDLVANDDAARRPARHRAPHRARPPAHRPHRGTGHGRRTAPPQLRDGHARTRTGRHGRRGTGRPDRGGRLPATVRLLSARERPTAVFAFNDIACVGALSAAEELGLRVPHDLSLVGYDNTYLARLRHLWLTTVDNAGHDVGRRAAQCLLDRIADPARPAEVVLSTPVLEVRGTTAAPRETRA